MNSSDAHPRGATPEKSSLRAHPWFPKMIGVWFAALFGLCSLALAPETLERIVTTLGIDKIVPAAAPPLGQTARLLLALGMAGVGEIAGLLIGAQLAAPRIVPPVRQRGIKAATNEADRAEDAPQLRGRDRHPDAPARKPLSATSDLGDDLDSPLNDSPLNDNPSGIDTALRRRALASESEQEPRPFFEVAPLPGHAWQPPETPANQPATFRAPDCAPDGSPEPFDLAPFGASTEEAMREAQSAPFVATFLAPPAPVVEPVAMPQPGLPPLAARTSPAFVPRFTAAIATASLEDLGVVQLSERLALALQARRARRALAPVAAPSPDLANVPNPFADEDPPFDESVAIAAVEPSPLPDPIAAPEAAIAPSAAFIPPPFAAPQLFAPIADDDTDEHEEIPALARSLAMPRFTANGLAEPAQRAEPIASDLERGLEILARRAPRPLAAREVFAQNTDSLEHVVAGQVADAAEDDLAEEVPDEALEEGYSSLLAMGSNFHRPEAVRIEEPQSDEIEPVVIFPGQGVPTATAVPSQFAASPNAPFARPGAASTDAENPAAANPAAEADPDETDRALRAALASLQRISGAR